MSKFLKFIVHLIVICTIICVLGMVLPPFFGVTTVIMEDTSQVTTNLPLGSVTYAIPQKTEEVYVGEPILVQEDGKTYRYNVASINLENGTGTVMDPTVSGGETLTVAVKDYVPKVVITLGYVGYLKIATRSVEGMIVLGLAVLFLIILYIIAELWKKEPQDDEEMMDDPAAGYVKSKKELKREEKERTRLLKEEEREIRNEDRSRKKKKKAEKKLVRTGGFVDEIEEDDDEYEEEPVSRPASMQTAASEAHELLKKEIAAATAEEPSPVVEDEEPVQETKPVVQEVKETVKKTEASSVKDEVDPAEIRKMAVPAWSASQLADIAKAEGDSPEIMKDDITDVTLFDYSDILDDGEE